MCVFFFSSRRRHTRYWRDWSSDVCSSDLLRTVRAQELRLERHGELLVQAHAPGRLAVQHHAAVAVLPEIGRASCRGKSVDLGGRRIIKKKKTNAVRNIVLTTTRSIRSTLL